MASEDAFQDAVALLQKTSSTSGGNVYDQLAKVVGKILDETPKDAVDLLETSLLVKKTAYDGEPTKNGVVAPAPKDTATAVALKDLYSVPAPPINEETGEPEEVSPPNDFECKDLVADASLFDAVGAGLGMSETYGVMMAMKKLGEDPVFKLAEVRFFGKFLGTAGDYYVFESKLKEPAPPPEGELPAGIVPPEVGTGANVYTYFVCSYLGGPFTQLPDVTPQMIVCARAIKKYFTGDLKADVSAYPPFPGAEDAFLRATIARIASATVVCPAGYFTVTEEGALEKTEEYAASSPDEMKEKALSGWCHEVPHIKVQGRCEFWAPEVPEGEEPPEPPVEPETSPEPLSTLDADTESAAADWTFVSPEAPAWAAISSSSVAGVKYQVTGVKSLVWPGAVAVYLNGNYANIYVGSGLKNAPFVPTPPPPVSAEYQGMMQESSELPPRPDEPTEEGEEAPAE